jgi:hypothetical protein
MQLVISLGGNVGRSVPLGLTKLLRHKSCQFADKQYNDGQTKNPTGQHFRPSHVTALKPSETTTAIACCYMEVKLK